VTKKPQYHPLDWIRFEIILVRQNYNSNFIWNQILPPFWKTRGKL